MKTLLAYLLSALTGCANTQTLTISARESIHAAAIAHARETLREAEDWRILALEAQKMVAP